MNGAPGWGSWSFDPVLWIVLVAAGTFYVSMLRRVERTTGKAVGPGHWIPYFSGLAVLLIALDSPLDTIGDSWLLWAHMVQHVLIADIAPPLLILGIRAPVLPLGMPKAALRRLAHRGWLGRFWGVATNPWVALPAWAAATWIWAIPAVFDFAAQHTLVHLVEHITLFYTGMALWWLIITPLPSERRETGMVRLAYLGFSRLASAAVCLPLTWLGTSLYSEYATGPHAYGMTAVTDQRLAGATMCLLEFLVFGIGVAAVFIDALGRDERTQALGELASSH
ncbi:MAG TPA: cytochrome c oxidase assembly protein [Solirubrobacteraceae bacterium]